jgi:hypothetical protein
VVIYLGPKKRLKDLSLNRNLRRHLLIYLIEKNVYNMQYVSNQMEIYGVNKGKNRI